MPHPMARRARAALGALLGRVPMDRDDARARMLRFNKTTVVVDCGANTGQYAARLRRTGYTGRIISFEPSSAAFSRLQQASSRDPGWTCYNLALGAATGEVSLNVGEESTLSSVLMPTSDPEINFHFRVASQELVSIDRLDRLLPAHLSDRDTVHLKLDVQGSELEVLAGASAILPCVATVECELPLLSTYRDQPSLAQVLEVLNQEGFTPVRLDPNYVDPESGYCVDIDALFRRKPVDL